MTRRLPAHDGAALSALQTRIGHVFADRDVLTGSLTHGSTAGSSGHPARAQPFERLEFLGDRVVGLVVADMLYRAFPDEPEGALSRRLAQLVRRESLADAARHLGLGPLILMSRSEADGGGRDNPSLLADAFEALVGAVYADGGLAPAAALVTAVLAPRLDADPEPPKDAKTHLQEWAQGRRLPLPVYTVTDRVGPDHAPVFTVTVTVADGRSGVGSGPSKRQAEQVAAAALLDQLEERASGGRLWNG